MTPAGVIHKVFPAALVWFLQLQPCAPENVTATTPYDYDYNTSTDYDDYPQQCGKASNNHFRLWFMPLFFSAICLLGLAGNLLVIVTVFYFQRLKTMTDVYLLNLAVADLLLALTLPLRAASCLARWALGLFLCKAMYTVYKLSFYSGMFLLSLISVDRYFAVAKAVSSHRRRTEAALFSKVSAAAVWVAALVFSVPEMVYTNTDNGDCAPFPRGNKSLLVRVQSGQIALGFGLPLLVMTFCYTCIVQTLCQARSFERNKAIKVILAVVAVFLLSQVPYNAVLFLNTVLAATGDVVDCDVDNRLMYATDLTQCLAFLRCCLNPFVYAFIGVKFRHDFMKLLKDFGCLSHATFYRYAWGRRRSSAATDTESTTNTFSP
ncbi:C-C chemokine receptor type 7 [Cololabis saira]|uniref:C-C chemokine receptor type 7 n=1 Tax=Cololabis saira TaxID=129043 RepID=UPI002AD33A88|nr:C-C chemokine receptor type 7 [Cololabis saira]